MRRIDVSTPKYPDTFALVDDEDYERVMEGPKWSCDRRRRGGPFSVIRFVYSGGKRARQSLHRFVVDAAPGDRAAVVEGNGLDCRKTNISHVVAGETSLSRLAPGGVRDRVLHDMGLPQELCTVIDVSTKAWPARFAVIDSALAEAILPGPRWHVTEVRTSSVRAMLYVARSEGRGNRVFLHKRVADISGMQGSIDHADGDTLHNRTANLRPATRSENGQNRGLPSHNTSGRKGVYWHKQASRWCASVKAEGRKISLGLFDELDEAADAYDLAALKYHGEFARTNAMLRAEGKLPDASAPRRSKA